MLYFGTIFDILIFSLSLICFLFSSIYHFLMFRFLFVFESVCFLPFLIFIVLLPLIFIIILRVFVSRRFPMSVSSSCFVSYLYNIIYFTILYNVVIIELRTKPQQIPQRYPRYDSIKNKSIKKIRAKK